jgi:hypothetical protein
VLIQHPARRRRLERGKLKSAVRVALDDELHEPVAQVADAIKQDQWVSWQLHR